MARRRSFVPQSPTDSSLEGRVVLSSIGDWFTSQYNHIKEDLGISHKKSTNAAAGIQQLWNDSVTLSKPTHTAREAHLTAAHPASSARTVLGKVK